MPDSVKPYFPFRDELSLQNGLIFKGERLVIPLKLVPTMLHKIHSSHIGIQGCLRRARESLYWPGMNNDIEMFIAKCETCNSLLMKQAKESLINHEIPAIPWQKVGTVDYYPSFFEIDRLTTTFAREVILKLKAHFARHGIPDTVMSDNGPQFTAKEFKEFSLCYQFEHKTSYPAFAQSNGKVENADSQKVDDQSSRIKE